MRENGATRIAVLISGGGSNLQAIIDAVAAGSLKAEIAVVFSNEASAGGIARALKAGIPVEVLDHRGFAGRESYDAEVRKTLERYAPDLVVLAGFMRILSEEFVNAFEGRILNIHPSLLPLYAGLNTHQRALEAGDAEHGCTVHFVTGELDGGPRIIQSSVRVLADDTPQTLAARVLEFEHKVYPLAVSMFAEGRLEFRDAQAWLDGAPLTQPVQYVGSGVRL